MEEAEGLEGIPGIKHYHGVSEAANELDYVDVMAAQKLRDKCYEPRR